MGYYGSTAAEYKEGNSPVTAADHTANELIVEGLQNAFPGQAILSEELKDSPARLLTDRVWIVDPLDGTKEFLAQNGEFSVMIGLAIAGSAVLGVVYLPDGDVLYAAAKGHGAWVERSGTRQALHCAPYDGGEIRMVGSRSHPDPLLAAIQEDLQITDVLPSGSVGVKCSLIAEGIRDLYVHPVPYLKEWDTCAPEVLLREAGGHVSDCLGRPLLYNKPEPTQPRGILACRAGLVETVLTTVAPLYATAYPEADGSATPVASSTP